MRFEGRSALVTGAASGIGLACAKRLAGEGARVALLDSDAARLERAAEECRASLALNVSVTDEDAVADSVGRVLDAHDGIDILVSCAGIQLFGEDGAAADLSLSVWQRTLAVNLTGTFLVAKHAIGAMLAGGTTSGAIVLTGSPTGVRGSAPGFDAYSTSKAAVLGLMRVLCADYSRKGIRVNAVIPGFTETPLVADVFADPSARDSLLEEIPLGRAARPEEIAAAVAFLVSDDASYVAGAALAVDGGFTAA